MLACELCLLRFQFRQKKWENNRHKYPVERYALELELESWDLYGE